MTTQTPRYLPAEGPAPAEGWELKRLTSPSRLYGANGIRTGPDGRIYVAQVSGSQISAIDIDSGDIEVISPMGGGIIGPDDIAFDSRGNLYATEFTEGRVSVRDTQGNTQVVNGNIPSSNPITVYKDRLFAGECRPDGRIMELDLNTGEPRVLLENVPMPNAMEVGPDGKLYFPVMGANEIWRVSLDGGAPEVVARDLGVPDSVKFDAEGFIVSTQVASGQVLRINPQTGEQTVLANIAPGLDNLTFVGDRLFVSSISGQINEVLANGEVRPLVPDGLNWPLGLAIGDDGVLFVADGGFTYLLQPGGQLQCAGMLFSPGFPGYTRGVCAVGSGEYIVTNANGQVARWQPAQQVTEVLAQGYERLYGVAQAADGSVVFVDGGAGAVFAVKSGVVEKLADGLDEPMGVALAGDGTCLVSDSAGGRVVKVTGSGVETALDGLKNPQGILVIDNALYVVDVGAKQLLVCDLESGARSTLVDDLPVGPPPGVVPKFLRGVPPLSGPMGPFAGIAAGPDGTLYVSADAEGSVLELRRTAH